MSGYPQPLARMKETIVHGLPRSPKIATWLRRLLLCAACVLSVESTAVAENYELERISHGAWIGIANATSQGGPLEECNLGATARDGTELSFYSYPNHSWMLTLDDKRLNLPAGTLVTATYAIDNNATLTRPVKVITQTAIALRFTEQSATFRQLTHGTHFRLSQSTSDIVFPAADFAGVIAELGACRDRWNPAKSPPTAAEPASPAAPAGGEPVLAAREEIATLVRTLGIPNASNLSWDEIHQSGLTFDAGFIAPELIVGVNILPRVSSDQARAMLDYLREQAAIACDNQAEIHRNLVTAAANHAIVGDIVTSCSLQGIKLAQVATIVSLPTSGVEVIQVIDTPGDRERPAESPAEGLHQGILKLLNGQAAP